MMRLRRTQGTRNVVFFFNDTATTEIYTLSLHDALPISYLGVVGALTAHSEVESDGDEATRLGLTAYPLHRDIRSEEHTSELQSQSNLVCRLLLEKKRHITQLAATGISVPDSSFTDRTSH